MRIDENNIKLSGEIREKGQRRTDDRKASLRLGEAPKESASMASSTAVKALAQSIRSEFLDAGVVPPPDRYAGISISSVCNSGDNSGSCNSMRLMMLKSILSKLSGNDAVQVPETGNGELGLDLSL